MLQLWLEGTNLQNVFTVPKQHRDFDALFERLDGIENIVVIGAGFSGIEYADVVDLIHAEAVILAMGYEELTDFTISANIASRQNEQVIND